MTADDIDLEPAPDLLARAGGHAVVDQNGRRVGSVIGLVRDPDTDAAQLAIRDERMFFWRRRLVPMEAVAGVASKKRRVVLSVDKKTLRSGEATPPGPPEDDKPMPWEEPSVLERIASYVERPEEADDESEPELLDVDDADLPSRHLLFASSSGGYALVEREGAPPAVGTRVDEPELGGSLVVIKVGSSPLPMDDRPCGFLERVG